MKRVRLFSDWEDSETLARRLWSSSISYSSTTHQFGNTQFVWGDDYDVAVAFNFAVDEVADPARTIGLVLEPQEILDVFPDYQHWASFDTSPFHAYYSFSGLPGFITAYGIGFPSVDVVQLNRTKRKHACMIVSNKTYTPYQEKRREVFAELLKTDLDIDFYGRGMDTSSGDPRLKGEIPPGGKAEILTQYEYVIDFENTGNALTDKFFDPIICGAVPITNSWTPLVMELENEGFGFVNFEGLSAQQIVVDLTEELTLSGLSPCASIYHEVVSGRLCLAAWIDARVGEMS